MVEATNLIRSQSQFESGPPYKFQFGPPHGPLGGFMNGTTNSSGRVPSIVINTIKTGEI